MKKIVLVILCTCLVVSPLLSQNIGETGYPLISNYSPKDYQAFQSNWAISQDSRGIMYFGNDLGLLEFDGSSWRLYQVPNKTTVRSIANSSDGKMYVGAVGELGYFMPDSLGRLRFTSLMNYLPKDKRNFSDVWQTFVNNGKVYFNASNYIFVWDIQKKNFKIIQGKQNFHISYMVNGKLFTREWGKGLEEIQNDSLVFIEGSEKFANERIYVMLPIPGDDGKILVVSRDLGMFKFDGKNFIPFKTEVDDFIKKNLIYMPGTVLSDGNILLGTVTDGAVVIDRNGKEIQRFNSRSGIISNAIYYTFQDRSGAVWLGTDNGVSRIDYSSPVTYFDYRNKFTTSPTDIIRNNGIIYAAGNNGVYFLPPGSSEFQLVKNGSNQFFILVKVDNDLLVGGYNGLFTVDYDKLIPIKRTVGNEYNVNSLKRSTIDKNRIYVGAQGLWSVYKNNGVWTDEGRILSFTDNITSMVEDKDGTLWAGTNASGIFKINFHKNGEGKTTIQNPIVEHFNESNGLQSGYLYITKIKDTNYYVSSDSIYKFDNSKKRFYSNTTDNIISTFYNLSNHKSILLFQQDSMGRLWEGTLNSLAMGTPNSDGTYSWSTTSFKRVAGNQVSKVYAEKNGIEWFLAGSGLIRYDFSKKVLNNSDYSALVRNVSINRDSTIFFGSYLSNPVSPEISFKDNSIKFNYSATSFEGKNIIQFKTLLVGFDKDWSGWSTDDAKEYTNLEPGQYTFKVVANNLNDVQSKEASFSFIILPPWYRAWWAYIGYIIILGFIVVSIDRIQRRRVTLKERQRSHLKEIELRAEAAEAESKALQAENDRKKNVELLSEIGKEITATLDLDAIFYKLYEHVNQLADATIFGIFHPEKGEIEYRLAIEKGKRYPIYSRDIKDKNQFPVWCIENQKPVFINDVRLEYPNYIQKYKAPNRLLEDGSKSEEPSSIIYLPLISQDRVLGVITIQSFKKNAYQEYHLNLLQNLASYTSIALDNADAYRKLNSTLNDLKTMQEKLVVQEKLASLGQLTAGIAHEIKNPLNFVNNFAQLSKELVTELRAEYEKIKNTLDDAYQDNFEDLISNIEQNVTKINEHGTRADSIVRSMLQHSRGKSGERILSDINAILDEDINLAYHGLRARDTSFNATIEKEYYKDLEKISIVPQDVSRVFLNIINNGFYEANKKKKTIGDHFAPTMKVTTRDLNGKLEVRIKDNGNGIPFEVRDKIFDPFFTTKPTGEGTGLGLSLSYDIIVKEHAGEIKFNSELGEYTEFIITLPKN